MKKGGGGGCWGWSGQTRRSPIYRTLPVVHISALGNSPPPLPCLLSARLVCVTDLRSRQSVNGAAREGMGNEGALRQIFTVVGTRGKLDQQKAWGKVGTKGKERQTQYRTRHRCSVHPLATRPTPSSGAAPIQLRRACPLYTSTHSGVLAGRSVSGNIMTGAKETGMMLLSRHRWGERRMRTRRGK